MQTEMEKEFEKNKRVGWSPAAPRKDCIRAAVQSRCSCPEITTSCDQQAAQCEVSVKELQDIMPDVIAQSYNNQFNHPLLNTLAVKQQTQRKHWRGASALQTKRMRGKSNAGEALRTNGTMFSSVPCDSCLEKALMATQPPFDGHKDGVGLVQEGAEQPTMLEPPEMGWLLGKVEPTFAAQTDEMPAMIKALTGTCSADEWQAMDGCLAYFWSCEENRAYMERLASSTDRQTQHMNKHPMQRPSFYTGVR